MPFKCDDESLKSFRGLRKAVMKESFERVKKTVGPDYSSTDLAKAMKEVWAEAKTNLKQCAIPNSESADQVLNDSDKK